MIFALVGRALRAPPAGPCAMNGVGSGTGGTTSHA